MSKTVQKDEEVLTINLAPYLTPISILISGVMITLAILASGRSTSVVSGNTNVTVTPTAAAEDVNPAAQTTIDDDPYLGNKETAKVAIVEFSDYECPFCQRHHEQTFPSIIKDYVDSGKAIYVFRDYIAVPSHNPAATTEAYAATCLREQLSSNAKYFEYADLLFKNSKGNGGGLDGTALYDYAKQVGANADTLKTCIESAKFANEIAADEAAADAAGVQGTPGFVVGVLAADGSVDGKIIAGAYPYETFKAMIEEMLAR